MDRIRRAIAACAMAGLLATASGATTRAEGARQRLICRFAPTWPLALGQSELRARQGIWYGDGTMLFWIDFPLAEMESCDDWDGEVL